MYFVLGSASSSKGPLYGDISSLQVLITIRIHAEFDNDKNASGLELIIPMPQEVQRVSCSYEQEPKPSGSQSWDWQERAHRLIWKFKRVQGGSSHVLKVGLLTYCILAVSFII